MCALALAEAEKEVEMAQMPAALFAHQIDTQLVKHVRPPTKKDLGVHLRRHGSSIISEG